jgi:CheY-like chemotaxis protein
MNCDVDLLEILLVEDNPHDAELVIRALRNHDLAHHLVHLPDGQAALDFLFGNGVHSGRDPRKRPKVVLLDLKLPKVDGIEVLRRIRSDERTKQMPVVVLTSSREVRDIDTAYQLGANSFIVKPVEFESFLKVIRDTGLYWLKTNVISNC